MPVITVVFVHGLILYFDARLISARTAITFFLLAGSWLVQEVRAVARNKVGLLRFELIMR